MNIVARENYMDRCPLMEGKHSFLHSLLFINFLPRICRRYALAIYSRKQGMGEVAQRHLMGNSCPSHRYYIHSRTGTNNCDSAFTLRNDLTLLLVIHSSHIVKSHAHHTTHRSTQQCVPRIANRFSQTQIVCLSFISWNSNAPTFSSYNCTFCKSIISFTFNIP